ncbi:hypothetical protein [Oerskovia turbata]
MTAALNRATEANYDSHQDVALDFHGVPKIPLAEEKDWVREQWLTNTRRALSAALTDPDDPDWLAKVLWPYPHLFEEAMPDHQNFYRGKAAAVVAAVLGGAS